MTDWSDPASSPLGDLTAWKREYEAHRPHDRASQPLHRWERFYPESYATALGLVLSAQRQRELVFYVNKTRIIVPWASFLFPRWERAAQPFRRLRSWWRYRRLDCQTA